MKIYLSVLGSLLLTINCYAATKPYELSYSVNPPFALEDGKGIAISIVSKMFERAKLPFKMKTLPALRGMKEAKDTDGSCFFPVQRAMGIEADYKWVSPIFVTVSGLFVGADSTLSVTALSDAKTLKIGVLLGSGDAEYLKGFGYSLQEVTDQEQNISKLDAKHIDVWATDEISAASFSKKTGKKVKELIPFRKSLGSLACSTKMSDADVEKLNKALFDMTKDGTLEKLSTI